MRVNARFDAEAEQHVTYLAEVTGMGVSEVLRTSVRARRGGLRHLSALIGQGDSGRSDVAGTYKARLVDGWSAKHGAPIDAPHAVHEPEAAFKRSQPAGGA